MQIDVGDSRAVLDNTKKDAASLICSYLLRGMNIMHAVPEVLVQALCSQVMQPKECYLEELPCIATNNLGNASHWPHVDQDYVCRKWGHSFAKRGSRRKGLHERNSNHLGCTSKCPLSA